MAAGRPDGRVVGREWATNIRAALRRACKRAGVDEVRPKDLRDTYASTLVTHGIVLKWVSLQLGHASVAVTEKHYAAYMAVDGYQNPWMCPDGCLPPDLLAELDQWAQWAPAGSAVEGAQRNQAVGTTTPRSGTSGNAADGGMES